MTKTKSTKRALLMSALALLMCVSMLIGSTFAWFTDSVTSGRNKIVSGNLDVVLEYKTPDSQDEWKEVTSDTVLFGEKGLWEPGHTEVVALRIRNAGTLALKYDLATTVYEEVAGTNVYGDSFKLSDYLEIGYSAINGDGQIGDAFMGMMLGSRDNANSLTNSEFGKSVDNPYPIILPGDAHVCALAISMPTTVGNEANYKTGTEAPFISFGVTLLATQATVESDSFNNQYDAGATFGTYIELNAGEDLLAAMAAAEADLPLTIKLNGNVEWPTEGHHGENDITPASSILIDGNGYTITATGAGVTPLGDKEAPMTLKNVKIVDNSVSYAEGAWEFTYLEMGGTALTCDNVTFADEIQTGTNATFTNCAFESNEASVYAVWVEGGSATFNNCTFTGYRGLKAHEDYGTEISSVIVKDCTFSNITKKPGIALGTLNADTTVSITGSAFINCQAGDQGLYIYETDTDTSSINFTAENNTVKHAVSDMSGLDAAIKSGAKVIDAQGANLGDFYYDAKFTDGVIIQNAKFTYFYGGNVEGTVTFENCEFVSDHSYSANFDSGNGNIIFNNCLFDGWSSFGTAIKGVEMNNCTFRKTYNYGILRFYQNAELNNCIFENSFEGVDTNVTGTVVKFTDCTGIDGKIFNNGSQVGTWIVNGTDISSSVTSW